MEITYTLDHILNAASQLLDAAGGRNVFAFHGEMGAGKTTLIVAVCKCLQVSGVTGSPTYAIINTYPAPGGSVFHIDLYRLNSEAEAVQAGVEDCLFSGNRCFVEWPENAPALFPPGTVHLYLEVLNESVRRVTICDN